MSPKRTWPTFATLSALLAVAAARAADPVRAELVVAGFDRVTAIEHVAAAGGQLYVAEQVGRIRLVDGGAIAPVPFLDIAAEVLSGGFEQGLTGLAFPPGFPADARVFVHYTRADGASVIARFELEDGNPLQADQGSELVMLVVAQPHATHNCNQLAFGPDGMLYIGCGDGGSGSGPILDPQWLGHHLGKLLRVDVSALGVGELYRVPPDNPYVGVPGALPEIWANGLRNPYRFSFDAATGDLWLADVGQASWEEINRVPGTAAAVNYGWPILEGTHCWPPSTPCDGSGYRLPVHEYAHASGRCSVIGGLRLRGSAEATLNDRYLFADFCTAELFALREGASGAFAPVRLGRADGYLPTAFGRDADGAVLVGTYGFGSGAILRLAVNDGIFDDGFEP